MHRFTEKVGQATSAEVDSITLTYADRSRSRLRVTTDKGSAAGLFLPRGTILNHGDLLRGEDGLIVRVYAASETVSRASTSDPLRLSRACYHLGNRHVALQIGPDHVCYLHDHVLDDMVNSLGLTVEVIEAPFEPEPGAYQGSSHGYEH